MAWSLAVLPGRPAAASDSPVGTWLVQNRDGVIRIAPCGAELCGRIIGLTGYSGAGAAPQDSRGRSECGLQILFGFHQTAPNEWQGTIVDPRDNNRYDAVLSMADNGDLHLRGYVLVPLLGSTQVWTRYAGQPTADCHMDGRP